MDISRNAKRPDTAIQCASVSRECLGCRDCKGPCLLYAQLYSDLVMVSANKVSTA